jgi:tRNA dimethylallyltransferase
MAERILVITGPTASGKTKVALEVARRLPGEIVSMDSRQVYRGMDIGTAKPTPAERRAIPHHGLDLVDPGERYSAGRFAADARRWIGEIARRGRVPLLVGGTGFFLRALTAPFFAEPEMDAGRRERLKRWLATQPAGLLARWAARLEPVPAAGADPQRLSRRIEVALLTGKPLSWWHGHAPPAAAPLEPAVFVLELPRAELYRRINARAEEMIARGLAGEVRGLLARGYGPKDPGMKTTGYIELIPHVLGQRTLEEAVVLIQNATRALARRQLTWFRRQLPAGSVPVDADQTAAGVAEQIIAVWEREAI